MLVVGNTCRTNCALHGYDPQMTAFKDIVSGPKNLLYTKIPPPLRSISLDEDFNRWTFGGLVILTVADDTFAHSLCKAVW